MIQSKLDLFTEKKYIEEWEPPPLKQKQVQQYIIQCKHIDNKSTYRLPVAKQRNEKTTKFE